LRRGEILGEIRGQMQQKLVLRKEPARAKSVEILAIRSFSGPKRKNRTRRNSPNGMLKGSRPLATALEPWRIPWNTNVRCKVRGGCGPERSPKKKKKTPQKHKEREGGERMGEILCQENRRERENSLESAPKTPKPKRKKITIKGA